MTTEYPTLAEIVTTVTMYRDVKGRYEKNPDSTEYSQAVVRKWNDSRTITTVEQLDALPPGSVVMTVGRNQMTVWVRCGDEQKGVSTSAGLAVRTRWGSERGQWWMHGHDDAFPSRDLLYGEPELVILLWHPDEFKSLGLESQT